MLRLIHNFLIIWCLLFLLTENIQAATYYIDYNASDDSGAATKVDPWKRCPGMAGFSGSYEHSAGDIFVFKGGVTWPDAVLPLTVGYSGTSDNQDHYTIDNTWYVGGSYSAPIFDGENDHTTYGIVLSNRAYVTINGLKIVDIGESGVLGSEYGIYANPIGEGVIIQNCTLETYSCHGITIHHAASTNITNGIKIHNNDISHFTNCMEIFFLEPNGVGVVSDVEIYDNLIHDPKTQAVGGDHVDGLHFYTNDSNAFSNLQIYRNNFYGDWGSGDASTHNTAQIYLEGDVASSYKIYNNSMGFSNTETLYSGYMFANGLITCAGDSGSSSEIYSNTIDCSQMPPVDQGCQSCMMANADDGLVLRGNICQYAYIGFSIPNDSGADVDYNMVYGCSNYGKVSSTYTTLANWQAATIFGDNSSELDPQIASPGTSDLSLGTGSPAIEFLPYAQAPYAIFTDDINRNERGKVTIGQ